MVAGYEEELRNLMRDPTSLLLCTLVVGLSRTACAVRALWFCSNAGAYSGDAGAVRSRCGATSAHGFYSVLQ